MTSLGTPVSQEEVPGPIYYFGWVIQPSGTGGACYAFERLDTASPKGKSFKSVEEAEEYISKKLGRGRV